MAGYTREFLIDCFVNRYESLGAERAQKQRDLASATYDKYGKDEFRKLASLDAEAIRIYKKHLEQR